jgi:hypothetical protein
MKPLLKIKALLAGLSVSVLFLSSAYKTQANNTNQAEVVTCSNAGNMWKIQGEATNGISGEANIICEGQSRFFIVVNVMRQGNQLPLQGTNSPIYSGGPNSFCCPLELQDADGKEMVLLKPSVSSPESYPDICNITNLSYKIQNKFIIMLLPVPESYSRDFLRDAYRNYQLISFNLNDYFKLEKTGEYKLTVWPKIYKQSETNSDIYKRIDVPPVSVMIKWES